MQTTAGFRSLSNLLGKTGKQGNINEASHFGPEINRSRANSKTEDGAQSPLGLGGGRLDGEKRRQLGGSWECRNVEKGTVRSWFWGEVWEICHLTSVKQQPCGDPLRQTNWGLEVGLYYSVVRILVVPCEAQFIL